MARLAERGPERKLPSPPPGRSRPDRSPCGTRQPLDRRRGGGPADPLGLARETIDQVQEPGDLLLPGPRRHLRVEVAAEPEPDPEIPDQPELAFGRSDRIERKAAGEENSVAEPPPERQDGEPGHPLRIPRRGKKGLVRHRTLRARVAAAPGDEEAQDPPPPRSRDDESFHGPKVLGHPAPDPACGGRRGPIGTPFLARFEAGGLGDAHGLSPMRRKIDVSQSQVKHRLVRGFMEPARGRRRPPGRDRRG